MRRSPVVDGEPLLGLAVVASLFSLNRRNLLCYVDSQYLLALTQNLTQFGSRCLTFWIPEFSPSYLE